MTTPPMPVDAPPNSPAGRLAGAATLALACLLPAAAAGQELPPDPSLPRAEAQDASDSGSSGGVSAPEESARVTLDNGDILSGQVESLEGDTLIFRTGFGSLSIPVSRVASLESVRGPVQARWRELRGMRMQQIAPPPGSAEAPPAAQDPQTDEPAADGAAPGAPGAVTPAPQRAQARGRRFLSPDRLVARKHQMIAEAGPIDRLRRAVGWTGSFEMETALIEGVNSRREIYGDTDNTWTFANEDRLNFEADFDRESVENLRVTDRYSLTGSYDHFFDDRRFLAPSFETNRNSLATIRRSDLWALRLGYIAIANDTQRLELLAGPAYQYEKLADGTSQETGVASWEVDYDLSLQTLLDGLSFFHEHTGTLDAGDNPGRTQVVADSGLRYTFFGGFFLAGVLELDYDSRAPADDVTLERTYRMNVGYSW